MPSRVATPRCMNSSLSALGSQMMADAVSPLALPWREALDTAIVHSSACPVRITGSRAVIGTTAGSDVVIDGHEVVLEIDGRKVTLRTADLLGAQVCSRLVPQPPLRCSILAAKQTKFLCSTKHLLRGSLCSVALPGGWPTMRAACATMRAACALHNLRSSGYECAYPHVYVGCRLVWGTIPVLQRN